MEEWELKDAVCPSLSKTQSAPFCTALTPAGVTTGPRAPLSAHDQAQPWGLQDPERPTLYWISHSRGQYKAVTTGTSRHKATLFIQNLPLLGELQEPENLSLHRIRISCCITYE